MHTPTILTALLAAAICSSAQADIEMPTIAERIEQGKQIADQQAQAVDSAVVAQVNHAAGQLLAQMAEQDNPLVSGMGVALLLDAIADGASGDSAAQIRTWLHEDGDSTLADILKQQDSALQQSAAMLIPQADAVKAAYREQLVSDGYVLADDLKMLNQQVDTLTKGSIPKVLDSIDPDTRLVLVHALHFAAPWAKPFAAENSADQPFQALTAQGTVQTDVPMMRGKVQAVVLDDEKHSAIALPFADGYTLLLAMPRHDLKDRSDLNATRQWLDEQQNDLLGGSAQSIDLTIPKWRIRQSHNLIPVLQADGIRAIFGPDSAELPKISSKSLYVSQFKQDISLDIDEQGGKASAATSAVLSERSMSADPITLRIDRAFVYSIVAENSGMNIVSGYLHCPDRCPKPETQGETP